MIASKKSTGLLSPSLTAQRPPEWHGSMWRSGVFLFTPHPASAKELPWLMECKWRWPVSSGARDFKKYHERPSPGWGLLFNPDAGLRRHVDQSRRRCQYVSWVENNSCQGKLLAFGGSVAADKVWLFHIPQKFRSNDTGSKVMSYMAGDERQFPQGGDWSPFPPCSTMWLSSPFWGSDSSLRATHGD